VPAVAIARQLTSVPQPLGSFCRKGRVQIVTKPNIYCSSRLILSLILQEKVHNQPRVEKKSPEAEPSKKASPVYRFELSGAAELED
jgi:hypothetical protein